MADRNEKFKELANKRVNRALKLIRSISKLSNRNNYEYEDAQADKIVRALEKECKALRHAFSNTNNKSDEEFRL